MFVGVSKAGEIIGIQIGKGTVENLVNRIAQHTDPKIQSKITIKKIEGKEIIVIEVKPSGDKLVLADGRPYRRVGPSTRQMGKVEYERLILEKHKAAVQFDTQLCEEATLQDINKKRVTWYLGKREEIRKVKKPTGMSYQNLLINIGAARKSGKKVIPTNAGILFFGANPRRFFIQSQLRIVKFKGNKVTHPVIDRLDASATLCEMIDETEDFIRKDISYRTDKSFMREDKFEYPIAALREAITNALIHKNYRETADTRIFIFGSTGIVEQMLKNTPKRANFDN